MPGVIMENGSRNGSRTNHDRDSMPNGTNGASSEAERTVDKGKGRADPQHESTRLSAMNGVNGDLPNERSSAIAVDSTKMEMMDQINQLPPEIAHITEGFQPLAVLLSRLAQVTSNRLTNKITELASMPMPSSTLNGNGAHYGNGLDDNSVDNIRKKVQLLKFAEDTHADWAKVLVITQWSRISEEVSKVIDLKVHLDTQRNLYDMAVYELSEVKRSLIRARLPNPDLKTAVEVLSTGKASWMPDLGYIEPPPLTAKDLLKTLRNLNTLLSIRMNLQEYDKIPYHFKNYTIKSGRVTFRVPGEFEVDLTIADENPDTQFWFIDFRFLFSPAVSQLPDRFRGMIENRVNAALEKEGLAGCYKFLHELVLTHKITELRRQAIDMARSRWIETLYVEPLDRSLSIQYWVDRYGRDGPKSWVLIGVHSGRRKDRLPQPKDTSYISIRWFRDSKEVRDVEIPLELTELSTESLIRNIVQRHISYILSNIYDKLRTKPLFSNNDLQLCLQNSPQGLKESALKVQLTHHEFITVRIEPVTGFFAISPTSRLASQAERKLNTQTRDPSLNGHEFIENLRCVFICEAVISRALSVGWVPTRNPGLKSEDMKPIIPRDTLQLSWFRRKGWHQDWFVALSSSMSGERWWLMEITNAPDGPKIKSHFQIPLNSVSPDPTHAFLSGIHLFAAALLTQYVNARELHSLRVLYVQKDSSIMTATSSMKVPSLLVQLEGLPVLKKPPTPRKLWAKEVLKISFQGLESAPAQPLRTDGPLSTTSRLEPKDPEVDQEVPDPTKSETPNENAVVVAEAAMIRPIHPKLLVKQRIDRDVAFHPSSGAFAVRLQNQVGEPVITALSERLQRVQQLVQFVQTVNAHSSNLHCETVSLGRIVFRYILPPSSPTDSVAMDVERSQSNVAYRATIDFAGSTNPVLLTLEPKNPHIRILDLLSKVLNSPTLGLNALAKLLPLTLPVLSGLDAIESNWSNLSEKGDVTVFVRAVDWYIIRYTLNLSGLEESTMRISFSIRLQHRGTDPWWCIRRERDMRAPPPKDDVDSALQVVWDGEGEGMSWRGMQHAGIGRGQGVTQLIGKVDAVMRNLDYSSIQNHGQNGNGNSGMAGMSHIGMDGATREMIVID